MVLDGGCIKLNQSQKGYIAAEGLIALALTVLVIMWFAVNQQQLHHQLSRQEKQIEQIRQRKEQSDQEVEDANEKKARLHVD